MAAHQAPPSLGFSRQEHWSGLPFPSPRRESEKWKWSCSVMILSDPMDCSLPGSSVHGIFQARVLEWGAIAFSKAALTVSKGEKWTGRELLWRENEETGSGLWMSRIWGSNSNWYTFLVTMFVYSVAQLCLTLCKPMESSMPGFPVLHYLLEFAQMHVHWVSDVIQPSPPSPLVLNLSQHMGLFQWFSSLHQVAKVLEFQLQHQSFQWLFRTDSFRIDWFYLLAAQGTLKSLLQHHSSEASVLWRSAFFIVQLSHPYMTAGKTIALTR